MRTHVEFRSSIFPAYPEEESEVNPGRHGKRLAEYGDHADGYLCFIEPSQPFVRRGLMQKVETRPDVERVAAALEAVLIEAGVRDLTWREESPGS